MPSKKTNIKTFFKAVKSDQATKIKKTYWSDDCYPITPPPYEYAVLSNHAYRDDVSNGDVVELNSKEYFESHRLNNWQVLQTITDEQDEESTGLYARLYINNKTKQIVLSYRGTDPTILKDIKEDYIGVYKNLITKREAKSATIALDILLKEADSRGYHPSVTGHSMGAILASIATFHSQYRHDRHVPGVTSGRGHDHEILFNKYKNIDLFCLY
jgi:hypothetical protein